MPRTSELRELTRHRILAFARQPEAVFWVFGFPMLLAAVLGFAFQSSEPAPSKLAVLEADGEHPLVQRLEDEASVQLERFADRDAAEVALRGGKVDALLLEPDAEPPKLRLDPTRPEAELVRLRALVTWAELDPEGLELDRVTEHGSRYVDFLYPGLLGMNLMGTGLWAIGFAVADMRQRRILRRLLVTPMRKSSFLASFILSRLVFLALEVVLLTAFGVLALGVPIRGSLLQLAGLCLLGAVSFAGLGLLCASRVKTIEGASGMINLVMLPMWLGSGVFFSYERFPELVQPVLRLLPLTALNDALRETMLDGAGVGAIGTELGILVAWMVIPFALALRIFRWV